MLEHAFYRKLIFFMSKLCHDPPTSTTTHHHPKYVHHQPPPAKTGSPSPTTITARQYISTTTYHFPKHGPPPGKGKIYPYITSFRHCFNSSFFSNTIFLSVTEILRDKVLISSFFKFQICTTFSTFYDI